jgi:hypothetical protein
LVVLEAVEKEGRGEERQSIRKAFRKKTVAVTSKE